MPVDANNAFSADVTLNEGENEITVIAVSILQKAGIVMGKPGNIFDPSGFATKAESARIIAAYLERTLKN